LFSGVPTCERLRQNFVLKDLERASECAYFDYQRDRVYYHGK